MKSPVFHPATIQLLRLQSGGRGRRMWQRFCQPRRLALSAIACALTVVWLGNTAMTIWLREPASPATLRALLSLGLVAYTGWHLARAAFFRPESPFDWSPAESEILAALPLRPRDLVAHQLASVTLTTLFKTGLFTLLLLPDLRCVPLGFLGVLLAMMTLEFVRMAITIATWGASRATFLTYRVVVVAALLAGGSACGSAVVGHEMFDRRINASGELFRPLLELTTQRDASAFRYAALPFQPLVDLILADRLTATNTGVAAAVLATIMAFAVGVIRLYAATAQRVTARERLAYGRHLGGHRPLARSNQDEHAPLQRASLSVSLTHVPCWGGAGALAWRQLLGARQHWGSLLTAMIAPAVLACAPCFAIADPHRAFLATTGALAFYTFLLLPTALRFDFRRDLDRLATFKSLPITPIAAVMGQTLSPVLISAVFQGVVLAFAVVARSLSPNEFGLAMLVMIPLNVLVFALDNLIYLLYPYRMQQEGLEIVLRTILTFTGKGLLFTVGMAAVAVWGLAVEGLAREISHGTGIVIPVPAVFTAGVIAGSSAIAALVLCGLCRTYRKLDPIEDLPR